MVNTCDACDPTPSQPKIPTPRYWNGHLRTGTHHSKDQQPSRLHLVRKQVRPKELAKNIQHLFVGFLPDSQAFSAPSLSLSLFTPRAPKQEKRMNPFHNKAVLRLPHQKRIKPITLCQAIAKNPPQVVRNAQFWVRSLSVWDPAIVKAPCRRPMVASSNDTFPLFTFRGLGMRVT